MTDVCIYLNVLLPYFAYLTTDDWRRHRGDRWDGPREAVQESVRDYLVYQLACPLRAQTLLPGDAQDQVLPLSPPVD